MPNQVRVGVGVTGAAKASSDVDRLRDKFTKLQKQSAKGVVLGAGAGVGLGAFSLASRAVGELTDLIGDATRAAIEDEASQQKLRSSLEANVPAWHGNTEAIEDVLKARMKLGFSDDEQRDSLAKIVVATHDVNKALAVQSTAMDLARLKGVSLADAGEALTKVEGGQFRALKAMGIVLKAGATATDALAAVQKAAKGQAEAYAQTTAGKMLVAQTRMNEAMEAAGYRILPVLAGALENVQFALDKTTGGIDKLVDSAKHNDSEAIKSLMQTQDAAKRMGVSIEAAWAIAQDAGVTGADAIVEAGHRVADQLDRSERSINQSMGAIGSGAIETASDVKTATKSMSENFDELVGRMADDAQSALDDYFDPIETHSQILADHQALRSAQHRRDLAKDSAAERAANDDIISALDDQGGHLDDLGKQHKLTGKDVDRYKKDVNAAYASMGKKVPAELQKAIDKLAELAAFEAAANVKITVKGEFGGGLPGGKKARGGPAGGRTLVGEEGPEIVDLPGGSYVHDANESKKMTSGGGVTHIHNYNLTVAGDIRGSTMPSALDQMNRLRSIANRSFSGGR